MKPQGALIEGAVLAAVGAACLAFQLWLPSTRVDEADYEAVARALEAERQPGDVVLLAPWWAERARLHVPAGLPVVGYLRSDGDDLKRHPRVWVLSQPRLPNAQLGEFERAFLPGRAPLGEARRFGNLALQLYQNGRARPVAFDAAEALPRAQVYLEQPDGTRQPCAWSGAGHRCPNGRVVAREWHEVRFQPLDCVRLDAPGGATRVVVEFDGVPATATLGLEGGYFWEFGAHASTSSTLGLEVNGVTHALDLPNLVEKLHRLEVPGGGGRVRLWLSSPSPVARHVCATLAGFGGAP